jgi:hypothetical protein
VLSVLGFAGVSGAGSFEFGLLGLFGVIGGGSSPFIPNKAYLPAHTIQGNLLGAQDVVLTQVTGSKLHPCPSVPPAPPGVSLHQNIAFAKAHPSLRQLIPKVVNGGDWDYKRKFGSQYDAFGNFNFGAAFAAAGYTKCEVLRGGAAYHYYFGTPNPNDLGTPFGSYPYGNTLKKEDEIKAGYDYVAMGCD